MSLTTPDSNKTAWSVVTILLGNSVRTGEYKSIPFELDSEVMVAGVMGVHGISHIVCINIFIYINDVPMINV